MIKPISISVLGLTMLVISTSFWGKGCHIPVAQPNIIGFYNVENLFDTLNDPSIADDEFTPTGKQGWTAARYQKKLDNLGRVFQAMGPPALLGLAEIENRYVLQDLRDIISLANPGYEIIHFDSPDPRGIDVGLLFQAKLFQLIDSKAIPVSGTLEHPPFLTRDILYARFRAKNDHHLHVFVNHWPSRSGGVQQTAHKRMLAAKTLKNAIDELYLSEKDPNIIIMGDFNDTPRDSSVQVVQQSFYGSSLSTVFTNPFDAFMEKNEGSYNYKGNWDMLDQILVSKNMYSSKNPWRFQVAGIFQQDWMMYKDYRFGLSPSRTYGGPNYYGGYSDHLPVFIQLK